MGQFNLTPRMIEVMKIMLAAIEREDFEGGEIVQDGCDCFLGNKRISPRTVRSLLSLMALRETNDGGKMRRYTLNDVGRALVRRPAIKDEIIGALLKGGSWTVENDKLVII